jgi:hypothetical protein
MLLYYNLAADERRQKVSAEGTRLIWPDCVVIAL